MQIHKYTKTQQAVYRTGGRADVISTGTYAVFVFNQVRSRGRRPSNEHLL